MARGKKGTGKKAPGKKGTKATGKRHRKQFARDAKNRGITKPVFKRISYRSGIARMGGDVYDDVRAVMHHFLNEVLRSATYMSEGARRKTIMESDIAHSLKVFKRNQAGTDSSGVY